MNYTFFAIACYVMMRAMQQLFAEHTERLWYKRVMKGIAFLTLYAAISSLLVWYVEIALLGFDPS